MKHTRWQIGRCGLAVCLVGAAAALAKPPTTRPHERGEGREHEIGGRWQDRFRGRRERLTPDEQTALIEILKQHSPKRWAAMEQLPEDAIMKRVILERYRDLPRLQKEEPQLFEKRVHQLELEEDVFDLVGQWNNATDAEKPPLRDALRGKIAELFDMRLEEHKARIERLQKDLEEQKAKLKMSDDQRSEMIERRLSRILEHADDLTGEDPPRDRKGPPPGEPPPPDQD